MGPVASTVVACAVIVILVGGALAYIIHAKKSGRKCIGCPDSKECSGKCGGCGCDCHGDGDENQTQEK